MKGWNYRIVMHEGFEGRYDPYPAIHEVYYEDDGSIRSWSNQPIYLAANDAEELRGDIDLIIQAFDRPILTEMDGKLVELAQ